MVTTFNVDYMHCVLLGITKKMIHIYLSKDKAITTRFKFSKANILEINLRLKKLEACIPNSFCRKVRSLEHVDGYKATELRQFILYTGKIVLKDILYHQYYQHFLSLNCAISICNLVLISNQFYMMFAQKLLVYFVERGSFLFGERFCIYNVHSLLHLVDDVIEHGILDNNSAFKYENYLQKIKRMVRGGKCPLTQIINRLSEYNTHILISRNSLKKEIINVKFPNNLYSLSVTTFCQVIGMVNNRYVCRVYIGESLEKLGHFELSIIGCLQADINKYKEKVFDIEI